MRDVLLKDGTRLPVQELTAGDLPDLIRLQEAVIDHLPEKGFLQPLSEEEFRYILDGHGLIFGVWSEGRLVAFRALLDPGDDPEHLGKDAGIPEEEWPSVLYSEITNVAPDFQGNGFQRQLGSIIMEAVDTARYRYLCTTVAPFNIASIKDKLALGMHIAQLTVKYGSLTRYVMLKYLGRERKISDGPLVDVPMDDTVRQQGLLASGWVGTSIGLRDGVWTVRYQEEMH